MSAYLNARHPDNRRWGEPDKCNECDEPATAFWAFKRGGYDFYLCDKHAPIGDEREHYVATPVVRDVPPAPAPPVATATPLAEHPELLAAYAAYREHRGRP